MGQPRGRADREGRRRVADSADEAPILGAGTGRTRRGATLGLAAGLLALIAAIVAGGGRDLLEGLAGPPPILRAALVGIFIIVGVALLGRAVQRLEAARGIAPGAPVSTVELGQTLRGIRFVFLAVAAFAAAAGWLLGNPLPIVIGLVIAGVDVAETSLLLLVATTHAEH